MATPRFTMVVLQAARAAAGVAGESPERVIDEVIATNGRPD